MIRRLRWTMALVLMYVLTSPLIWQRTVGRDEVSWDLQDEDGNMILAYAEGDYANGFPGGGSTSSDLLCLNPGCYTFNIFDGFGDGMAGAQYGACDVDGNYTITDENANVLVQMAAANYGAGTSHNFCLPFGSIWGCTDPLACNYDTAATNDDGSCILGRDLTFTINTDCWGGEVSWEILDGGGAVVASVPGGTYGNQQMYVESICLADDCYTLNVFDAFGDGMAGIESGCAVNGSYILTDPDGDIVAQMLTPNYGGQATHVFCLPVATVLGCTEPAACNYDSGATSNDGSCDYSCYGCTDSAACNFDSTSTLDDGSCDYSCYGCLDTMACNYDSLATIDDGSCQYIDACGICGGGGTTPGCIDTTACNFDSLADCDDGSCDYGLWYIPDVVGAGPIVQACSLPAGYYLADQPCAQQIVDNDPFCVDTNWDGICNTAHVCCANPVAGCLDPGACNYDSTAGCEDGSCIYLDACGVCGGAGTAAGCIDTTACNFNSLADCDDGSCTYPGCIDTTACNYDSSAGCDDGSCAVLDVCGVCGGTATTLGCTDTSACNFSSLADCDDGSCTYPLWYIPTTLGFGPIVQACAEPVGYFLADQPCAQQVVDNDPFCVDTEWDAICEGAYQCCVNALDGCMDSTACNYDSTATCDDGSCLFTDACGVCGGTGTIAGCTDSTACNYDSTADCDDGSCAVLDACGDCGGSGTVAGCTDALACNYNSTSCL